MHVECAQVFSISTCAQVKLLTCLKRRELISLLCLLPFQWMDRMFNACVVLTTDSLGRGGGRGRVGVGPCNNIDQVVL